MSPAHSSQRGRRGERSGLHSLPANNLCTLMCLGCGEREGCVHVGTLRGDTECSHVCTSTGRCLCVCVHISSISWITPPLHQFTSGHTVGNHGGLVAWEAVCRGLRAFSKDSWPAFESWLYSSHTSCVTNGKLPNLS